MSDLIESQQNYNPGGDGNYDIIASPLRDGALAQWTGGVDYSDQIAYLPERLEWDKKAGGWKCESFIDDTIHCKLLAATTLWARWSETVGRPEDMQVGVKPQGNGYDMGIRLIVEIDEFLYYWDAFGVTFKSAQSAVRRAHSNPDRMFTFDGSKLINTRFGPFFIPALEKSNEAGHER